MRLALLFAAMALPASAAAVGPAPTADMPVVEPNRFAPGDCPPISRFHARSGPDKEMPRKLNELPNADAYASVYRRVGGCEAPIIIRYGPGLERR